MGEFGGELTPGTQARLAIETMHGVLIVRSGRDGPLDVQPGQMFIFRVGSFAAENGKWRFCFSRSRSLASPMQSGGFRAKAAPARADCAATGTDGGDAVAGAGLPRSTA
jgi:hypothetical protein